MSEAIHLYGLADPHSDQGEAFSGQITVKNLWGITTHHQAAHHRGR